MIGLAAYLYLDSLSGVALPIGFQSAVERDKAAYQTYLANVAHNPARAAEYAAQLLRTLEMNWLATIQEVGGARLERRPPQKAPRSDHAG